MIKGRLLFLAALLVLAQSPATQAAEPIEVQVVKKLQAQGYVIKEVGTTLLGRLKIDAEYKGTRREVIADNYNGTILRDAPAVTYSFFGGLFTFGQQEGGEGDQSASSTGIASTATDGNGGTGVGATSADASGGLSTGAASADAASPGLDGSAPSE